VVVAACKVVVAVTIRVVKVGVLVKVIWVEVPIRTCWPPVMERLEEETVKLPKVVVPIPPLATPKTPLTSDEPRAIAPLNRAPPAVDLTGRAEFRELMVVEPRALTENIVVPVEEAKINKG